MLTSPLSNFLPKGINMKNQILLTLALLVPTSLVARKVLTPEQLCDKFTQHVMADGPAKQLLDTVFSDKIVCDTLFDPIKYETLKKTKQTLREHGGLELNDYCRKVVSHPDLPTLLIKCGRERNDRAKWDNISRVCESQKMRDHLLKEGITDIVVPHKWLYHLPNHDDHFCDGNYEVVVEKLDILKTKENKKLLHDLPINRARHLLSYLIEMNYPDISDHNIYFLKDRKTIAIVDTEFWHWANNPNWVAKRFMTLVNSETVRAILDDEFCTQYKLKTFEVLYQELQDKK